MREKYKREWQLEEERKEGKKKNKIKSNTPAYTNAKDMYTLTNYFGNFPFLHLCTPECLRHSFQLSG